MPIDIEQAADKFLSLMGRLRRLGARNPPLEEARISPSLLTMMEYAALHPNCGIREIADGLNLSMPTISVGVRQLEKAGFMGRQPHPLDGRAVQVFLTPKGQALYQRTHEFRRQRFERLLTGLTPEERSMLLDLLERAICTAENEEQGGPK